MVSGTARLFAALAVLGLALAGCGGSDDDDGGEGGGATGGGAGDLGACIATGGCIWYRNYPAGSGPAGEQMEAACTQGGATWADACPSAELVGICAQASGNASVETWYYAPTAVADVEAACAATGATFRATP